MVNKKQSLSWDGKKHANTPQMTLDLERIKYPFILRNNSSDVPTFRQIFIDNEYNFNVTKPPEVLIDAGANIGLASIYFSNKYPNAQIISIEPEESNFQLLKSNTASYKNIIPIQAALWSENGKVNLLDPGLGHWGFMTGSTNTAGNSFGSQCHEVKSVTVDRIIEDYGLDNIDILKIDIEGAEKEVFRDTSAWILKVNSLIIELHERMKQGCNRSFYNGSNGFDNEWKQGENIYLTRREYLTKQGIGR
tara:strand:- start:1108 stop:1854 length:747 start_codon:yes stop_codon:yes gene_type:complete